MFKINSIYDYLRWRGLKLLTIWALIPIAGATLIVYFASDKLSGMTPTWRLVCLVLLLGAGAGGPLTYAVLMFRTPCPRCGRALGRLAFLGPTNNVLGPVPRCPHCRVNIFEPLDTAANAE